MSEPGTLSPTSAAASRQRACSIALAKGPPAGPTAAPRPGTGRKAGGEGGGGSSKSGALARRLNLGRRAWRWMGTWRGGGDGVGELGPGESARFRPLVAPPPSTDNDEDDDEDDQDAARDHCPAASAIAVPALPTTDDGTGDCAYRFSIFRQEDTWVPSVSGKGQSGQRTIHGWHFISSVLKQKARIGKNIERSQHSNQQPTVVAVEQVDAIGPRARATECARDTPKIDLAHGGGRRPSQGAKVLAEGRALLLNFHLDF